MHIGYALSRDKLYFSMDIFYPLVVKIFKLTLIGASLRKPVFKENLVTTGSRYWMYIDGRKHVNISFGERKEEINVAKDRHNLSWKGLRNINS